MNTSKFQFDGFTIDLEEKRLEREGKTVPIQPRVYDLLVFLVKHHGELVSRDDLMNAVWADAFVEETNLRFCIHSLRKTLGKNSDGKDYIETIPKRGHRFTADVREVSPGILSPRKTSDVLDLSENAEIRRTSKRNWLISAAVFAVLCILLLVFVWLAIKPDLPKNAIGISQLAILPFETVTENERREQSGLMASLNANLSKIRQLRVLPAASVQRFSVQDPDAFEAGKRLGADAFLSGSYRIEGEDIMVKLSLLRLSDRATIWTEDFTASGKTEIERENAVALRAARLLSLKIADAEDERLLDSQELKKEAKQNYLAARKIWRRNELFRRKEMFGLYEKTIELEPNWALAYASYSEALLSAEEFAEEKSKIRQIAERAIQLDKSLPQPHSVMGEANRWFDWNWKKAESQFKLSINLDPDYTLARYKYARLLMIQRRFGEAEIQLKKAISLEPFSPLFYSGLCELYSSDSKLEQAISSCRYANSIEPGYWRTRKLLFWIYTRKKMFDELDELLLADMSTQEKAGSALAISISKKDLTDYWQHTIAEPVKTEQPISQAGFYLQIGDKENAIKNLEKALEMRQSHLPYTNYGLEFESIRNEKRFAELMKKIGL